MSPVPLKAPLPLPALIACVDSSEDVLLLVRDCLVDAGYRAVTYMSPIRYGAQPVIDFVTYLAPDLAIYMLAPPYRESWAEYERLREEVPECPVVPATTNKVALDRVIGPSDVLEILVEPSDLDQLLVAVQARLAAAQVDGQSPTRSLDGISQRSRVDGGVPGR